ncbi:hypothetical protein [Phycicoccus flavus]|uniref:hypothetical protein n=1 Tax=Phycicoccus flavus TaxID=2502783 RepID=UPI000FEBA56E|nr:hypothetical protein [Phycicoccus flavus]NHA66989.1 hypothetical protein [Phycicoccus flavus]
MARPDGQRAQAADRSELERRVHVDLPRLRPEDLTTSQASRPARDPFGGRDPETEFMLRQAGAFWP